MPDSKIAVPKVYNVAELKRTPKGVALIHFTSAQWKSAIKGIEQEARLPKGASVLNVMPVPNGDDGMIIVSGDCVAGPNRVCKIRPKITRGQPGQPPGSEPIEMECVCIDVPGGGGQLPPGGTCRFVISRTPTIRFRCVRDTCTGTCRLTIVRTGPLFQLVCRCS
jgi:hypothetical protein